MVVFCWKACLVRGGSSWIKNSWWGRKEDSYSVHTKCNTSSNSSADQPSGGLTIPYLISIASLIMGILQASSFVISLYFSWFTVLISILSTLGRFVWIKMFLRFDPVVVLVSLLTMLYSCFRTGFFEFLKLRINLMKFLMRMMLMWWWPIRGSIR